MADKIIEQIRRRADQGSLREPYLKAGERVRITEGDFSGLEAIFLASESEKRVVLLLNILQSEQRLIFPIESVRGIEGPG